MSFLSLEFTLFFILVFGLYWFVLKETKKRKWLLLVSSLFFIFTYSPALAFMIFISAAINIPALKLVRMNSAGRDQWLILSLLCNFILVVASGFFTQNKPELLAIVGLSFYYFKVHSLFFDVFNEHVEEDIGWKDYFSYLSFFPTVLSGPVMNYSSMTENSGWSMEQISFEKASSALLLFLRGMAKKILVSTLLYEGIANFLNRSGPSGGADMFVLFMLNFFYITADLSAYTDMARGLAGLLGFEINPNFNFSYAAKDIGDFWKRHHMSVSNWFRQYVFFPFWVGLSPLISSFAAGAVALLITFLSSGLWHSFSKVGLIFALLHFLAFSILLRSKENLVYKTLNFFLMWIVVLVTFWGLTFPMDVIAGAFKSFSLSMEKDFLLQMMGVIILFLAFDWLHHWIEKNQEKIIHPALYLAHSILLILCLIFWDSKSVQFLYFNF